MSVKKVIEERGKQYGDFSDTAAVSQELKRVLFEKGTRSSLSHVQHEALELICMKMARIVTGTDPGYADNWRDIAGYAVLGGGIENE